MEHTPFDALTARRGSAVQANAPELLVSELWLSGRRATKSSKLACRAKRTASGSTGMTGLFGFPVIVPLMVLVPESVALPVTFVSTSPQVFSAVVGSVNASVQFVIVQVTLPIAPGAPSSFGLESTASLPKPQLGSRSMSLVSAPAFRIVSRAIPLPTSCEAQLSIWQALMNNDSVMKVVALLIAAAYWKLQTECKMLAPSPRPSPPKGRGRMVRDGMFPPRPLMAA